MTTRSDNVGNSRKRRPDNRRAWMALGWGVVALLAVNAAANRWLPERLEPWGDPTYHVRRELLVRRLEEITRMNPPGNGSRSTLPPARPRIAAAFGSSRFMGGLNGAAIESEFNRESGGPWLLVNFGAAGGGPVDSLVHLNRLIVQGPQPDLVLIEILPNQLNQAPGRSSPHGTLTLLDAADQSLLSSVGIPFTPEQTFRRTVPYCALWNYRKELIRMSFPRLLPSSDPAVMFRACDASGTVPISDNVAAERRSRALAKARRDFHGGASQFRFGGEGVLALSAALRLCNEHGIPAGLVIMPEGPMIRQLYRAGAEEELRTAIRDLAARGNAYVIDCWDSQREEAFLDSHHLLAGAARVFSAQLARHSFACLDGDASVTRLTERDVRTESR